MGVNTYHEIVFVLVLGLLHCVSIFSARHTDGRRSVLLHLWGNRRDVREYSNELYDWQVRRWHEY